MLSCRCARVVELADTPNKQPVFISTCVLLDEDLSRNKPRIHNTVRRTEKRRLQVVHFASVTNAPKTIPHERDWVSIPPSPPYLIFPAFESVVSISTLSVRPAYSRLYIQMY